MAPGNEIPSFFKGILFRENLERLTLPKAFGPYLKGSPSTKVFLRNPYRDLWPVEMVRSETGEYTFEEGWPRFAKRNKLEDKDFLIFQYNGNSIFDFKIYGKYMDEKEYTRFPEVKPDPDEVEHLEHQPRQLQQPSQPRKQQQLRPGVVRPPQRHQPQLLQPPQPYQLQLRLQQQQWQPQQQCQLQQSQPQEPMQPSQQPELFLPPQPHQPQQQQKQPLQRQQQSQKQQPQLQLQPEQHRQQQQRQPEVVLCDEMEPERELEPEVEREHERVDYEKEDNDDFLFEIEEEIKPRNKKRKRALSITEADQDVVFQSGKVRRADNPYFMTQRRNKTRNLYVPASVVQGLKFFNLKLPENLDFCDECNRRWPTKVSKGNDGRTLLRGGWEKVCRWNNVRDPDLCLCEFIPATQEHEMFLKISVVRDAARWLPVRRSW